MARLNALADVVKGLKANIHVIDNLSPISRVAVYVRAGSRYEPDNVPGIAHFMRASAGLTTQDSSIFGITRHTERAGARFQVSHDREFIVYRMDCMRDKLGYVLGFIDDTLHKPEFRSWELVDVVQPRLKHELEVYKKNQSAVANEAMHKAAFRGGLAHSMYAPEHQVTAIKNKHLFEYLQNNFVLERMTFTGLSVDENELKENIEERFNLNGTQYSGVTGASRYIGGGEARIQAGFAHTMVNFVVQGCSGNDLKSLAALEVIGTLLGGHQQKYIKYGDGHNKSLSYHMRSSPGVRTSIINLNYTDTGLFGFSICGPNEVLREATKSAVRHVRQVLSSISEQDLSTAKKATHARALIQSEDHNAVFEGMCRRHAHGVQDQNLLSLVEKLSLKNVQAVAGNLLKSKPTMVAVGNPRFVPYIDELDS